MVSKDSLEIKVENDALSIEGAVSAATPQAMEATYAEGAFRAIGAASRLAASSTRVTSKLS